MHVFTKTPRGGMAYFLKKSHCVHGSLFRDCKGNKLFSPFTVKLLFSASPPPSPMSQI